MTQGVQQEMLHKEQPKQQQQAQTTQEQEVKQEPEKLKFGGGSGGGGKPFIRFGSSSSFSSVVCRPDPERPGHQICKKVVRESTLDPITGQRTERNIEKEEDGGPSRLGSFFGLPSSIQGRHADEPVVDQQKQESQTIANQVHDFVDRGVSVYDHGRSFFTKLGDLMHFGQSNNYGGDESNGAAHHDDEEEHYDYDDSKRYVSHAPTGYIEHPQEQEFFDNLDQFEREIMDSFFGRSAFGGPPMGGGPLGGFGPFGHSHPFAHNDPFDRYSRHESMGHGPYGGAPFGRRHESFAENLHRNLIDEIEREMFGRAMHRPDMQERFQQQSQAMKPQEVQPQVKPKMGKGKIYEV